MGNLKRCLATFLIVAMLLTTNGMSVFAVSIVKTLSAESNDLVAESKGVGYYYEHYSAIYESRTYLLNDSNSDNLEDQSKDYSDSDKDKIDEPADHENDGEGNYDEEPEDDESSSDGKGDEEPEESSEVESSEEESPEVESSETESSEEESSESESSDEEEPKDDVGASSTSPEEEYSDEESFETVESSENFEATSSEVESAEEESTPAFDLDETTDVATESNIEETTDVATESNIEETTDLEGDIASPSEPVVFDLASKSEVEVKGMDKLFGNTEPHNHKLCGVASTSACTHTVTASHDESIDYTPVILTDTDGDGNLNEEIRDFFANADGSYYLTHDLAMTGYREVTINHDINLCLNGFNIRNAAISSDFKKLCLTNCTTTLSTVSTDKGTWFKTQILYYNVNLYAFGLKMSENEKSIEDGYNLQIVTQRLFRSQHYANAGRIDLYGVRVADVNMDDYSDYCISQAYYNNIENCLFENVYNNNLIETSGSSVCNITFKNVTARDLKLRRAFLYYNDDYRRIHHIKFIGNNDIYNINTEGAEAFNSAFINWFRRSTDESLPLDLSFKSGTTNIHDYAIRSNIFIMLKGANANLNIAEDAIVNFDNIGMDVLTTNESDSKRPHAALIYTGGDVENIKILGKLNITNTKFFNCNSEKYYKTNFENAILGAIVKDSQNSIKLGTCSITISNTKSYSDGNMTVEVTDFDTYPRYYPHEFATALSTGLDYPIFEILDGSKFDYLNNSFSIYTKSDESRLITNQWNDTYIAHFNEITYNDVFHVDNFLDPRLELTKFHEEIRILPPHDHKICGVASDSNCAHEDIPSHTGTSLYKPLVAEDFANTVIQGGYYYLLENVANESTSPTKLELQNDLYLCLNGYTLENYEFTSTNLDKHVYICNCSIDTKAYLKNNRGDGVDGRGSYLASNISYSVFGVDLEDGSGTNLAANVNQIYFAHMDTATSGTKPDDILALFNIDFVGNYEETTASGSPIEIKTSNEKSQTVYIEKCSFEDFKVHYNYPSPVALEKTAMLQLEGYMSHRSVVNIKDTDFIENELKHRLVYLDGIDLTFKGENIISNNTIADKIIYHAETSGTNSLVKFENGDTLIMHNSYIEGATLDTKNLIQITNLNIAEDGGLHIDYNKLPRSTSDYQSILSLNNTDSTYTNGEANIYGELEITDNKVINANTDLGLGVGLSALNGNNKTINLASSSLTVKGNKNYTDDGVTEFTDYTTYPNQYMYQVYSTIDDSATEEAVFTVLDGYLLDMSNVNFYVAFENVTGNVLAPYDAAHIKNIDTAAFNKSIIVDCYNGDTSRQFLDVYKNRNLTNVTLSLGSYHEHTICGNPEGSPCTHTYGARHTATYSYVAVTSLTDLRNIGNTGGAYYLMGNIELDDNELLQVNENVDLYLCLNGHSLSGVSFNGGNNSHLVITNCKFTTANMTFPVKTPAQDNEYPMFKNLDLEVYGAAYDDLEVNNININSHHVYYDMSQDEFSLYKTDIRVSNTLYNTSYPMFHVESNDDIYVEDVYVGDMNWGNKQGYLFELIGDNTNVINNYFKNVTIASISKTALDINEKSKFFNLRNRNRLLFEADNYIDNNNMYGEIFNISNDEPGGELKINSGSLYIRNNTIDGYSPLINSGKNFTIAEGASFYVDNNKIYRHNSTYSLIDIVNNFNVYGNLYLTNNKLVDCTTENAVGDVILIKYNPTTMPIKVGNSIIYIDNNKSYSDVAATTEWTDFDNYPAHKINGIISLISDDPTNCIFRVEDGKKLDVKNSLIRFGFDNTNCMGTVFSQWSDEYVQEFSSANFKDTFVPDIYSFGGRRLGMSALLSGARVYTDKHYHKVCGVAANEACQHTLVSSHEFGVTYEFLSPDITQHEFINLMASSTPKNYVLSSDITITDYYTTMNIKADINLCLNGHVLKNIGFRSYGSNNRVITITNCLDQEATLDSNRQAFYDVNVNVYGVTKNYISGQGTTATTSNLKIKANDFYRIHWLERNLQMYGVNITSADSGDNSKFIQVSFTSSISIENVYVDGFIAGSNNTKSFVSTTAGPEGRVAGLDMKLKDVEICNFDSKNTTLEDATPLYLNGWRDSTKLQTYGKVDIHDMNAAYGNILRTKYLIVVDGELNIHDCSSGQETLNLTGDSQTEFYITENTKLTVSDNKVIRKSDGVTTVVKVEPTVWSRLYGDLSVTDNKIINCATTNNAKRVFVFYDYDGSTSGAQKNIDFGNGKIIVKDNYSYKDEGYTKITDFNQEGYDRHQVFDIGKGNEGATRTSSMYVFTQSPNTKLDANSKFNFAIYNYKDDEFIYSGNVYNQWKEECVSSFSELYYGDVFKVQMPTTPSVAGGQLKLEGTVVKMFPIDHFHKECGVTGECVHTLDAIGQHTTTIGYEIFVDDTDTNISKIKKGGRYVLTEDFDLQTRRFISPTSDLYICLNGHSLKNARFGDTDAKIVICNCSTNQSTIQSGFEYDYTDPVTAEDHRTFRNVDAYVYGIKDDTQSTDELPVYNLKINTLLLHTGTNTNKKAFSNVEFTWAPPAYDTQSAYDNNYIDIKNDMTAIDSYLAMENVYANNAKVKSLASIGDDSPENSYGKKVYIKNTLVKTVDCRHSILSLNNNVDLNFYGVNRINNFDVYNVGNAAFSATRSNLSGNTNITVHDGELNFNNSGSGSIWSQNIISLYNTNFTINENAKLKMSNCSIANQASKQYRTISCLYIGDNANVYNNGDIEITNNIVSNDLTSINYPNRFFAPLFKSNTAGEFTLGNGTINVYGNQYADTSYNKYCYQVYDAGNNTDYKTSNNMPTTFKLTGTGFRASESKLTITYNYADETSEFFGTGRGILAENFDSSHVLGYTDDLYKSVFTMRADQNTKVYEMIKDGSNVLIRFIPHDHLECGASHSSECNHNLISQHTTTINYVPLSQWMLSSISNATFDWYYYIDDDCGQVIDLGGKTFNLTNDTYICLNGRTLKNVRFTEPNPYGYKLYITNCKDETATIDNGNLVFARAVEPNIIANNGPINFKGEMFADGITDAFTLYNIEFEGTGNDTAIPGTINMLIEMQPGYGVLGKVILSSVSVTNYYKHFNAYYLYLMRFANIDVDIDKLKLFNNKMDPHGTYIDGRDVAFINYYMSSASGNRLAITNSEFYDNETFSLLSIPNTATATLDNVEITNNKFSKNIFEVTPELAIGINGKVVIANNEIIRKTDTQSIINAKYVSCNNAGALEIINNKFNCADLTSDPTGIVSAVYVPSGSTYKIGNSYMVVKGNESINDTSSSNLNHVFGIYSDTGTDDGFIEQLSGTKIKYDKTFVDSVAINTVDGRGVVYKNWDADHVENYAEYCYEGIFVADPILHGSVGVNRNTSTAHLEISGALQHHRICGSSPLKECEHRGIAAHTEILEYEAIDGNEFRARVENGGKFFLYNDITTNDAAFYLNDDLYLCLNGHNITFTNTDFRMRSETHGLYICNCSENEASFNMPTRYYSNQLKEYSMMSSGGKINATQRDAVTRVSSDASAPLGDLLFYNIEFRQYSNQTTSGFISDEIGSGLPTSNIIISSVSFVGLKGSNEFLYDGIIATQYNKCLKIYDTKFIDNVMYQNLIKSYEYQNSDAENVFDNVEFVNNTINPFGTNPDRPSMYWFGPVSDSDDVKHSIHNVRDYNNTYGRFFDLVKGNSFNIENFVASSSNLDTFMLLQHKNTATLSNITIDNSTMNCFIYSNSNEKVNITGLDFHDNIVNNTFMNLGLTTDALLYGDNSIYDNTFGATNTDANSGVFNTRTTGTVGGDINLTLDGQFRFNNNSVEKGSIFYIDGNGLLDFVGESIFEDDGNHYINNGFINVTDTSPGHGTSKNIRIKGNTTVKNLRTKVDTNSVDFIYGGRLNSFIIEGGSLNIENCDLTYTTNTNGYLDYSTLFNFFGYRGYYWEAGVIFEIRNGELNVKNNKFAGNMSEDKNIGMIQFNGYKGLTFVGNSKFDFSENNFTFYGRDNLSTARTSVYLVEKNDNAITLSNTIIRIASNSAIDVGASSGISKHVFGLYASATGSTVDYMLKQTDGTKINANDSIIDSIIFDDSKATKKLYGEGYVIKNWTSETVEGYTSEIYKKVFIPDLTRYVFVEAYMDGNDVKIGLLPHVHKLCGTNEHDTCTHRGIAAHTATISYLPISDAGGYAFKGYYALDQDMVADTSTELMISGDLYLCLAGHKIKNYRFTSMFNNVDYHVYITDCIGGGSIDVPEGEILFANLSGGIISNNTIEVKTDKLFFYGDSYSLDYYEAEYYNVKFNQRKSGEIAQNTFGFMKSSIPGHVVLSSISVAGYRMNETGAMSEYTSLIYLNKGDVDIIDSKFSNNNFDLFVRTHSANIRFIDSTISDNNLKHELVRIPYSIGSVQSEATVTFDGNTLIQNNTYEHDRHIIFVEREFGVPNKSTVSILGNSTFRQEHLKGNAFEIAGNVYVSGNINISDFEFGNCSGVASIFKIPCGNMILENARLNILNNLCSDSENSTLTSILTAENYYKTARFEMNNSLLYVEGNRFINNQYAVMSLYEGYNLRGTSSIAIKNNTIINNYDNIEEGIIKILDNKINIENGYIYIKDNTTTFGVQDALLVSGVHSNITDGFIAQAPGTKLDGANTYIENIRICPSLNSIEGKVYENFNATNVSGYTDTMYKTHFTPYKFDDPYLTMRMEEGDLWVAYGGHEHTVCGVATSSLCHHEGIDKHDKILNYKPCYDAATLEAGGKFFLAKNIDNPAGNQFTLSGDLYLCLNGYSLNRLRITNGNGYKVYITNCRGNDVTISKDYGDAPMFNDTYPNILSTSSITVNTKKFVNVTRDTVSTNSMMFYNVDFREDTITGAKGSFITANKTDIILSSSSIANFDIQSSDDKFIDLQSGNLTILNSNLDSVLGGYEKACIIVQNGNILINNSYLHKLQSSFAEFIWVESGNLSIVKSTLSDIFGGHGSFITVRNGEMLINESTIDKIECISNYNFIVLQDCDLTIINSKLINIANEIAHNLIDILSGDVTIDNSYIYNIDSSAGCFLNLRSGSLSMNDTNVELVKCNKLINANSITYRGKISIGNVEYKNETYGLMQTANNSLFLEDANVSIKNCNTTTSTKFLSFTNEIRLVDSKLIVDSNTIKRNATSLQEFLETNNLNLAGDSSLYVENNKINCAGVTNATRSTIIYLKESETFKIASSAVVIRNNTPINDTASDSSNHLFAIYSKNINGIIEQAAGTKFDAVNSVISDIAFDNDEENGSGIVYPGWSAAKVKDIDKASASQIFVASTFLRPSIKTVVLAGNVYIGPELMVHTLCGVEDTSICSTHKGIAPHSSTILYFIYENSISGLKTKGRYYLDEDLDIGGECQLTGDLSLCLNGHKITNAKFTAPAGTNYKLNITDCVGGGEITGIDSDYLFENINVSIVSCEHTIKVNADKMFNANASTKNDLELFNVIIMPKTAGEVSGEYNLINMSYADDHDARLLLSSASITKFNARDLDLINVDKVDTELYDLAIENNTLIRGMLKANGGDDFKLSAENLSIVNNNTNRSIYTMLDLGIVATISNFRMENNVANASNKFINVSNNTYLTDDISIQNNANQEYSLIFITDTGKLVFDGDATIKDNLRSGKILNAVIENEGELVFSGDTKFINTTEAKLEYGVIKSVSGKVIFEGDTTIDGFKFGRAWVHSWTDPSMRLTTALIYSGNNDLVFNGGETKIINNETAEACMLINIGANEFILNNDAVVKINNNTILKENTANHDRFITTSKISLNDDSSLEMQDNKMDYKNFSKQTYKNATGAVIYIGNDIDTLDIGNGHIVVDGAKALYNGAETDNYVLYGILSKNTSGFINQLAGTKINAVNSKMTGIGFDSDDATGTIYTNWDASHVEGYNPNIYKQVFSADKSRGRALTVDRRGNDVVIDYVASYSVIYNRGVARDINGVEHVISGNIPSSRATRNTITTIPENDFRVRGFKFLGFKASYLDRLLQEGEQINLYNHLTTNDEAILTAMWEEINYSIIIEQGESESSRAEYNDLAYFEVATMSEAFVRQRYKFRNFEYSTTSVLHVATTAKPDRLVLQASESVVSLIELDEAVVTYLPTFDEITYTIRFDGNGATSGTMQAQIATLSIDTNVNDNKFEKTGYHFVGWATSSTATTSWIADKGELVYPTMVDETIDGKEIKLYAVWETNKYSLVFNRGEGEHGEDKRVNTEYNKIATVPDADGFKKDRYKFGRYKWVNTIYHGEATTSVMPRSGFETLNPNQEITNLTEENDVIFNYEVEYDEVTYTIAFDGNGATSGTMSPQRATLSVVNTRLKPNSFAKDEIPFQGWALATDSELWLPNEGLLSYPDKVDESVDGTTITLYAIWNINDYSLIFNKGDGDTGAEKVVNTRYGRIATAPNAEGYYKSRHKFGRYKWIETIYEGKATTSITPRAGFDTLSPNQTFSSLTIYEATLSYIAEYDDITYTLSFDGNGSTSGSMPAQIATLSIDTYVNENKFERTGYHFLGWATSSTTTDIWIDNMGAVTYPTMVDESIDGQVIDLYAVWEPNEYSLVFNKGTGTEGSDKRIDTKYGELATVPNADGFKKNRYKFGRYKWVNTIYHGEATTSIMPRAGFETLNPNQEITNLTEENDVIFNYEVEYDEVTYTIAFDGNGATSGTMSPQRATLSVNTHVNKNTFSKTGYHFIGWGLSSTSTAAWVSDEGELTYGTKVDEHIDGKVIKLYAVWKANEYSLVFNKGTGTQGSDKRVDTKYDVSATVPDSSGYYKPKYKFGRYKWVNTIYHGEATTSIMPKPEYMTLNPNDTVTNLSEYEAIFNYQVEYDVIHYNIHFNENGGVGSMADQPATLSDTTYLHLNQFTRTGYKFIGWANSGTGPVVYADGGSIGSNLPESVEGTTVELYAKWQEIKYNVVFKNGSSVIKTYNNINYTQAIMSPQEPASSVYRFVEFRTLDAASVSSISANTSVSMLTAIDGNTITYDTIFEEITFNVVFDANGGSGSMAPILATLSKAIILPTNGGAISRADMGFEGWSKTNGEANPINFQDAATLPVGTFTKAQAESGSVTIYACWSYDNYILRINPNGHGGSSSRDVALSRGSVYQLVATFSDSSYNLVSYNSSSNGRGTNYAINSNYSNNCPRTAVINIYAIWQYKGGGGGGPGGGGSGGSGGGGGGGIGGKLPGAGANGYVGLIVDKPGVYNVTPKGTWLFDPNVQQWVYGINAKYEDIVENMNIPHESVMNNSLECLANGIYRMNSGKYFCFDSNGLLRVGLIEFNGTIYYAETSGEFVGALCSGSKTIDGIVYEFDASGEYIKPADGVKNIDAGIWVYNPITNTWGFMILTETGDFVAITNGMYGIKSSNNKYDNFYFDENGIMQVGIVYYNGKYHYMSEAAADRGRENVAITNTLNP